jgi:capsid protein
MAILNEFGNPVTFAHAADRSTRRGPQFAVRNDDIDKLIPSQDRRTLASLSNRLFWNMGVPRACVLQKADYAVGEAWLPSYLGPDQEAGKQVAKFMSDVWMPQCDVRGGVFDWWKLLELTSIATDKDGDNFWIMVKGDDGFPRIQIVPNHRCHSGSYVATNARIEDDGPFKGYRVNDGVIYYASGRAAGYRFDVSPVNTISQTFKDLPASDVIHNFDPTHSEQGRGLPAFTHALESLKMSLFSTEDERIRQQIISRLHLTIFNESGGPDPDDPLNSIPNKEGRDDVEFSSRSFPGGVYYSANGDRIEQMRHENPGPIWDSFQDRIVRDAVISVWSYSVWKGSGQGTDARAEVVKCRRYVTKRQSQLWNSARRAFAWAYSVFAEQGRVPKLKNPMAWDFSRPPRLSVDDGRESKMENDELRTGSRNMSEVLGARGLTEDEFYESRARSVWMRKYKAITVAEELNKTHNVKIEIEDREMFMQTPNEMGEPDKTDAPDNNQDDKQTTQEDDDA